MKSQQEDKQRDKITLCSSCAFYSGYCKFNRIDKYKNLNKVYYYEEAPVINDLCNLCRTNEWADSKENAMKEARNSVMPSFGIAVLDMDNEGLDNIVSNLMDIDYPENLIRIIFYTSKSNMQEKIPLLHKLQTKFKKSKICFELQQREKEEIDSEVFQYLVSSDYFVKVYPYSNIYSDMFLMIDNLINEKLTSYACYEFDHKNKKSGSIIQKNIVRKIYLQYHDYDKMQEDLFTQSKHSKLFCRIDEK